MNLEHAKNFQEYQLLGFMITEFVNLAQKYKIPIFCLIQSNRSGIDKIDTSILAGGDRIGWMASSLSDFKIKTPEELELDGAELGNRKLSVLKSRFGPGLLPGDYINFIFNGAISKITESKTHFEVRRAAKQQQTSSPNEIKPFTAEHIESTSF